MNKGIKKVACFAIVLVVIMTLTLSFASCGEKTRYNYVSTTMSEDSIFDISSMFDVMYKGSYILVSESSIEWVTDDTSNKMSCKKNGDRVLLGGDYLDRMSNEMYGGEVDVKYYGQENDDGYTIIVVEKISGYTIEMNINFEKA